MTLKEGNKILQVTLPPFHQRKLAIIQDRTSLSRSNIIQRLIENFKIFADEESTLRKILNQRDDDE